jgi:hypothetical protein
MDNFKLQGRYGVTIVLENNQLKRKYAEQNRQSTYNVTRRRVRETTVAVEKQWVLHIPEERVHSPRYPACNAHAPYCHLWPLRLLYFSTWCYKRQDIYIYNRVLTFFTNLSETFFILRRTERHTIINVNWSSHTVTLFLSGFKKSWIFSTDFLKVLKYQITWNSVKWGPGCSVRTNGRTVWRSS